MKILSSIRAHKYIISSILFSILFLFPIMRNALQSISLMVFLVISVTFYYKIFLIRIKALSIWKIYGILTGFFWFSLLTFLWTSDKIFFFNELRPSIAIAFVPFVLLFFHPPLTQKSKHLSIVLFLVSLIIYAVLWFTHHVEGVSIYQEIIAKESPIRDESVMNQIKYFLSRSYKDQIGGLSIRGYELLGKNSFFSHSNYISTYYLFGFILAIYTLLKTRKTAYKVIAVLSLGFSLGFLYYLSSKVNLFLFVIFTFGMVVYFLKSIKLRVAFLTICLIVGLLNISRLSAKYNEIRTWDMFEKQDKNLDDKIFFDYKRTKIYTCIFEELKTNYAFGIGLGDIQGHLNVCLVKYKIDDSISENPKEYNSHSQFLHFALVGGIINFVLFLGLFVYLFLRAYKEKNKLLFSFTLIIFASCFFENYLSRIYGVLFFILFITMLPNWKLISKTTATTES